MRYSYRLLSTVCFCLTICAPAYSQEKSEVETRVDAINASFDVQWNEIKERAEKIKDEAPEGFENAVGVDVSPDMVRYDLSMDIPEVTMRLKTLSMDLPQVTMRQKKIIWDNPETYMGTTNCGWYPEFRGIKVTMKEIRCDLPQIRMVRREAILDLPEFKVDRTEAKMHIPEITMKTHRIVFDLPKITLNTTDAKRDDMKSLSDEIASDSAGLIAKQSSEIKTVVLEDLVNKRSEMAQSFSDAEAKLNDGIASVKSYGIDPSAVKQEDGSFLNLYEALSKLQATKTEQLAKLDEQITEMNRV